MASISMHPFTSAELAAADEVIILGPWVANTVEVAEQLLIQALTLPFKNRPGMFVSAHHENALRLFERYGFTQQRTLSHMRRGKKVQRGRQTTLYGQASLGLG